MYGQSIWRGKLRSSGSIRRVVEFPTISHPQRTSCSGEYTQLLSESRYHNSAIVRSSFLDFARRSQIRFQNILDSQEDIAETRFVHKGASVSPWFAREVIACTVVQFVSPFNDSLANASSGGRQSDVVVDDENRGLRVLGIPMSAMTRSRL
jgi:hypothetical protein